jgi:hypothetical protein
MKQVTPGNPIKNQPETGVINIYVQKLQKQENNVKMIVFVIVSIVDFIINKK